MTRLHVMIPRKEGLKLGVKATMNGHCVKIIFFRRISAPP